MRGVKRSGDAASENGEDEFTQPQMIDMNDLRTTLISSKLDRKLALRDNHLGNVNVHANHETIDKSVQSAGTVFAEFLAFKRCFF